MSCNEPKIPECHGMECGGVAPLDLSPRPEDGSKGEIKEEKDGVVVLESPSCEPGSDGYVKVNVEGIIKDLLVTIQADKPEDVVDALFMLAQKENQKEACHQGAHKAVISSMRRYKSDENIQMEGCRCIQVFAYYHLKVDPMFSEIADAGGLEAIVNAMKSFGNSYQVQKMACGALANLFAGRFPPAGPFGGPPVYDPSVFGSTLEPDHEGHKKAASTVDGAAHRFVNDRNGIDLVVTALKTFPEEAKVQYAGCTLLTNLANGIEFRFALKQSAAMSVVAKVFEHHSENSKVTASAMDFLKAMFKMFP